MEPDRSVGLIVLAAGYGSRMGQNKGLLPLGGKPAIEHILDSAHRAGIGFVKIVVGHYQREFLPYENSPKVELVVNQEYREGMFSSIQRGIQALGSHAKGAFLLPVDCPLVSSAVFTRLLDSVESRWAVPTFLGKKGHPLYIPQRYFAEILSAQPPGGLKEITGQYLDQMDYLPVEEENILWDMDTPEDYQRLCEAGEGPKYLPSLVALGRGRRFFLVRHGEIQQHRGKIFLGQRDIPLSKRGLVQSRIMAEEIRQYEPKTDCVYTGTLQRALETAREVAGQGKLISREALNEMALGNWDGKYIEEIKKNHPEAYEERGRHLWRYKIPGQSENFYDLQYRVYKAMVEILEEDPRRDLILVSHKSCLRAIENNLKGKEIHDSWEPLEPGQWRLICP